MLTAGEGSTFAPKTSLPIYSAELIVTMKGQTFKRVIRRK